MTLYILVCGDKGRYDRPIDLDIIDTFTSLQQASLKLQQYIYQDPQDVHLIMNMMVKPVRYLKLPYNILGGILYDM